MALAGPPSLPPPKLAASFTRVGVMESDVGAFMARLSVDEGARLQAAGMERQYADGAALFVEGEPSRGVFVVEEGHEGASHADAGLPRDATTSRHARTAVRCDEERW